MESGPPRKGVRGPYFPLTFLFISPHLLICERGELYHLNEHKKLLHICQHVELVNYPCKGNMSLWVRIPSNSFSLNHCATYQMGAVLSNKVCVKLNVTVHTGSQIPKRTPNELSVSHESQS